MKKEKNDKDVECKNCAYCFNHLCLKGLAPFYAPMHLTHKCEEYVSSFKYEALLKQVIDDEI